MSIVAVGTTSLVAFTLPSTPRSARAARIYVRTALGCHNLGYSVGDVEAVTSELVSNAVMHARAEAVEVDLLLLKDGSGAVAVVVTDPCARPPVKRDPAGDAEQGRGLLMVEALASRWGWIPQDPGKAVFALFTRQG
jgi:anti-sigma regulatory factor (Ser/Thr protein kinase)